MADKMNEEFDWQAALIAQLDKDQPNWYLEWATGQELSHYAEMCAGYSDWGATTAAAAIQHIVKARKRLKDSVANRLLHRVINAAISAGVVRDQKDY